jgi:cobalt-zinc-cadmium efflux system outer membrane protein
VAPSRDSVKLGVRLPFGADVRNAPRLAEANARLIQAEAELRQTTVEVESEQHEALRALAGAEAALSASSSRAALANERLALQEKAFSLGELDLAEFIRIRASASKTRLDLIRAEKAMNAARARLNQSKGILP